MTSIPRIISLLGQWLEKERRVHVVLSSKFVEFSGICCIRNPSPHFLFLAVGNDPATAIGFPLSGWEFEVKEAPGEEEISFGVVGRVECALLGVRREPEMKVRMFLLADD